MTFAASKPNPEPSPEHDQDEADRRGADGDEIIPPKPKIGFSFSPGGLLFPYHLGVMSVLVERGYLTDRTPLAGASAGGIAVATHASGVPFSESVESCVRISEKCSQMGGARGRLLKLLEEELDSFLPADAHERINSREGMAGVAYREIFPRPRSILATRFESREELIETVCNSSMFPFFSSNAPFVLRRAQSAPLIEASGDTDPVGLGVGGVGNGLELEPSSLSCRDADRVFSSARSSFPDFDSNSASVTTDFPQRQEQRRSGASLGRRRSSRSRFSLPPLPRVVVDGFFAAPRKRFGCPEFPPEAGVDRTVTVSVFPCDVVGLSASSPYDRICPDASGCDREGRLRLMARLGEQAGRPSPPDEHVKVYERGRADGERWVMDEERQIFSGSSC